MWQKKKKWKRKENTVSEGKKIGKKPHKPPTVLGDRPKDDNRKKRWPKKMTTMDQKKNSEKNMDFFFIQKKKEQSDHEWKKKQSKREHIVPSFEIKILNNFSSFTASTEKKFECVLFHIWLMTHYSPCSMLHNFQFHIKFHTISRLSLEFRSSSQPFSHSILRYSSFL